MRNYCDIRIKYRQLFNETMNEFRKISESDFYGPTILPSWKINNVISHLAGNALYKTSDIRKMKHPRKKSLIDFSTLANIINASNEKWVEMLNSLDKNTLLDLYNFAYDTMLREFEGIQDLNEPAVHDVLWYSDEISPWWLDISREYTELWMHTAQISSYLDLPFPFEKQYSSAFFEICLLAIRRLYRTEEDEIVIAVHIGTQEYILSSREGHLDTEVIKPINASISMSDDVAWKIFSGIKLITNEINSIKIEGNTEIGRKLLDIESVMIKAT